MSQRRKRRNNEADSQPVTAQEKLFPKTLMGIWTGIVIGVAVTLGVLLIQQHTPLFSSRLSVTTNAPQISIAGTHMSLESARDLVRATICIRNSGLKAGSLGRMSLSPSGIWEVPDVKVVSFDRSPIGAFQRRPIRIVFLIERGSNPLRAEFRFELFDNEERYIGATEFKATYMQPTVTNDRTSVAAIVSVHPTESQVCEL